MRMSSTVNSSLSWSSPSPLPLLQFSNQCVVAYKVQLLLNYLQASLVEKQFTDLRLLLVAAAACQKPDDEGFRSITSEIEPTIIRISSMRETNRKDRDWSNHYAAMAEGAPMMGWVVQVR